MLTTPAAWPVLEPYRGAPTGQPSTLPADTAGPVSLRRVRLDTGGYAPDGTYWGLGAPLFHATSDDGDLWLRAVDREHAREAVRRLVPDAVVRP